MLGNNVNQIRREVSFHEKNGAIVVRKMNSNSSDNVLGSNQARDRQTSNITDNTIIGSTQHSEDHLNTPSPGEKSLLLNRKPSYSTYNESKSIDS